MTVFQKSYHLWNNAEKHSSDRHAREGNIIWRMRFACCIIKAKIQTYTQNIEYILLLHGNNGYANAPQCYVTLALCVLPNMQFVRVRGTKQKSETLCTKHWLQSGSSACAPDQSLEARYGLASSGRSPCPTHTAAGWVRFSMFVIRLRF
jgi:hypothetical protein